jgi:hypothetical protein
VAPVVRTKPSSNTTTVDRELTRVRRLTRHKCQYGGECCPTCHRLFSRLGQFASPETIKQPEPAE